MQQQGGTPASFAGVPPHFISARNGDRVKLENVVRGNQKVLTARLEDAEFFYNEDITYRRDAMRNRRKLRRYIITYDIVMTVLALISIGLVIFDLVGLISIGRRPFRVIDQSITLIFAIDYAIRFSLAPRKRIFVKTHVLDLLAIIPYNEVFTFLRFSRVGRFARLAKLSRLIGLSSKLKHISNRINRRNGFYFLLSVNSIIILISSSIIARVEHHNFIDDIW